MLADHDGNEWTWLMAYIDTYAKSVSREGDVVAISSADVEEMEKFISSLLYGVSGERSENDGAAKSGGMRNRSPSLALVELVRKRTEWKINGGKSCDGMIPTILLLAV